MHQEGYYKKGRLIKNLPIVVVAIFHLSVSRVVSFCQERARERFDGRRRHRIFLIWFGSRRPSALPRESWCGCMDGSDDTLTVSKAITARSRNGRRVIFPQLFISNEQIVLSVCVFSALLSLWHFFF